MILSPTPNGFFSFSHASQVSARIESFVILERDCSRREVSSIKYQSDASNILSPLYSHTAFYQLSSMQCSTRNRLRYALKHWYNEENHRLLWLKWEWRNGMSDSSMDARRVPLEDVTVCSEHYGFEWFDLVCIWKNDLCTEVWAREIDERTGRGKISVSDGVVNCPLSMSTPITRFECAEGKEK